jgi:dTMP kinase
MRPGKFITFEGGEGSGKSTQVRRLAARLEARGLSVAVTREPGGAPFAERLRAIMLDPRAEPHSPLSEALLFYAARADHLEKTIRPALSAGRWVVCDRFSDSTRVYQGHAGGLTDATLDVLERLVVAPTSPDLTVVIDIDPVVGLARADERRTGKKLGGFVAPDRFEERALDYHQKLREGFLAIARDNTERCVLIDGVKSADEVAEAVWSAVEFRLLAGVR